MSRIQELQKIKEHNNKEYFHNGYSFKVSLTETEHVRGQFKLDVILQNRVETLKPHLEMGNIICYDKTHMRYVESLNELENSISLVGKIIDEWDNDVAEDEIISELSLYISGGIDFHAYIDVASTLEKTKIDNKIHMGVKLTNNNKKIEIDDSLSNKTKGTFLLFKVSAKEIIELGYVTEKELKDFFVEKFNLHNNKVKKSIFVIESNHARSTFYIDLNLNSYCFAYDESYPTKENSRLPNKTALLGKDVLVIGVGSVGSIAIEMIASLWPSRIDIVDSDLIHRGSNVRQRFPNYLIGCSKAKYTLLTMAKFKGIESSSYMSKFPNLLADEEVELNDNYDVIIDFTGDGVVQGNFDIIRNKWPDSIIVSGFIQNQKAHVKIIKISALESLKDNEFIDYDLKQDKITNENGIDHLKKIKGCDPILEYSYLVSHEVALITCKSLVKYIDEEIEGFYAESN